MRFFKIVFPLLLCGILPVLTSCFHDDETDYSEWNQRNLQYIADAEAETTESGESVYTRMAPDWAPAAFILIKWENDRSLTAKELMPLDNSVCNVQYELDDIDGNRISDSYSMQTYGDGIYQTRPNQNIMGFWYALTQMHIGDEVTCIIPAVSGYGNATYGSVPPYSTLIYKIKLVSIPAYEVPN